MLNTLKRAGSPVVTLGLTVSLAAWYLVLLAAGSLAPGWQALDLGCFRLFGTLLLLNLVLAAADSLKQGKRVRTCFCLASLFLLLSAGYCYLFRFQGALSLAEGENYEPFPTTFSSGQKGALAAIPGLAFTVTRVNPDNRMGRVVLVQRGVATEIGAGWQKIGSSEIRFLEAGLAPLVVVAGEGKGELERSYVKLALDPPGKEANFMFDTLPYEFYLTKVKAQAAAPAGFHLNVRRGKLSLFDGPARLGQQVPVQGVQVSIQDERKFAVLEIRTRRGHGVLLAAAGIWALVALASMAALFKGNRGSRT